MPYLPHIVSFELKNGDSLGFNAIAKKKKMQHLTNTLTPIIVIIENKMNHPVS